MKTFNTTTEIHAPPEIVWNILTDSQHYPEWDSNVLMMEGAIAPGQQLTVYTRFAPNRAFKPTVTELEPNRRMVWKSGIPLGLFQGERTFVLEPLDSGGVRFSMQEVFSGVLLPLVGRFIPDLKPIFDEFSAALKQRAEKFAEG